MNSGKESVFPQTLNYSFKPLISACGQEEEEGEEEEKKKSWRWPLLCLTWQLRSDSLFVGSLFAGSFWPRWLLWEIKQQEQMAPGGFGVPAGEAKKEMHTYSNLIPGRVASCSTSLLFPPSPSSSVLSKYILQGLTDWWQTGEMSPISPQLNHPGLQQCPPFFF